MFILNILVSAQEYLTYALSYLADIQTGLHALARKYFILRPIVPLLVLCPITVTRFVLQTALFVAKLLCGEFPAWVYDLSDWMHRTTPYHMAWYYRIWLALYVADIYITIYAFDTRHERFWLLTLPYIILKSVLVFAPFAVVTPEERMWLWALATLLIVYECWSVHQLVQGIGRGIDWRFNSIYAAWGPHYHYRRMSGNRRITLMWAPVLYPFFKILFVTGMWWDLRKGSVNTSSYIDKDAVAKATLLPDFSSLSLFVEPDTVVNLRYGVLFILALSSLSVYSIILAGWSSNSKYAFIGALRSAAQMVSYEVSISLILLPVILMSGSLNFSMITYTQSMSIWFAFPLFPISCVFLIAMLAETNRTPFDLPEAEAELVAGYNVDYSSLPFAMFFLGEYCNMILIATMYCLLFLGGGLNTLGISSSLILALKAAVIWVFFVNVRATLPRYRYDQLMDIGWKVFLPLTGGFMILVFGILVFFEALPVTTELPLDVWNSFS